MIEPSLSPDEPFRLQALRTTGQLDTPLDHRFERITRLAQHALNVPVAAITLLDAGRWWFRSIQGLSVQEISRDISFCGHTILQNDVMIVPDAHQDERFVGNPLVIGEPRIVFYAGCPVRSEGGESIGTVCVIDHLPRRLAPQKVQALRDLAALTEAELRLCLRDTVERDLLGQIESEHRRAMVDPLTRVWNRSGLRQVGEEMLADAATVGHGAAVIMADIDHFKKINDQWGHPMGDAILSRVARRLMAGLREHDALGRVGGEEFVILCGRCGSIDDAVTIAERLRRRVGDQPFKTDDGLLDVTLSLGVSSLAMRFGDVTLDGLIGEADRALYEAKRAGRNRVCTQAQADQADAA